MRSSHPIGIIMSKNLTMGVACSILFSLLSPFVFIDGHDGSVVREWQDRPEGRSRVLERGANWNFEGNRENTLEDTENRIVRENIIVEDNATLRINNSTITLSQDRPFQFHVVVRDFGRLILENGTITSGSNFNIYLNNSGSVELCNGSSFAYSSFIVNARGGTLLVRNSSLNTSSTIIDAINILALEDLKYEKSLRGLEVRRCYYELRSSNSELIDLSSGDVGRMNITASDVSGASLGNVTDLLFRDSGIDDLSVRSYRSIHGDNTTFWSMVLGENRGSKEDTILNFRDSVIKDIIVDIPPETFISGGEVAPTKKDYLDGLCTSPVFRAEMGTDFNLPLDFRGDTKAILHNITAPKITASEYANIEVYDWPRSTVIDAGGGGNSGFHTPGLEVYGNAKIRLYRSLELRVLGKSNRSVGGVKVDVFADIGNKSLYRGQTDEGGTVIFVLLASVIENEEETFHGYYRCEINPGESGNTEPVIIYPTMTQRMKKTIHTDADSEETGSDDGAVWLLPMIILTIVILILFGIIAVRSRSGK